MDPKKRKTLIAAVASAGIVAGLITAFNSVRSYSGSGQFQPGVTASANEIKAKRYGNQYKLSPQQLDYVKSHAMGAGSHAGPPKKDNTAPKSGQPSGDPPAAG